MNTILAIITISSIINTLNNQDPCYFWYDGSLVTSAPHALCNQPGQKNCLCVNQCCKTMVRN
jgi:hypothetical protein